MQMRHGFAPILPLSVLGGFALMGGLCGPAAAQDNTQTTTTTQTTTQTTTTQTTNSPSGETWRDYWANYYALPEPLKYPEWSPGMINKFHWTDWTETNWAPGSTYDVELDRMKAEREFWGNRWKNGETTSYYAPDYGPGNQQAFYYREEAPPAGPAFDGGQAMAASGDFVYTVEDNTLYQMRASDLSMVTQHSLPTADTSTGNMGRWSSVAASGSFVYLLRGDNLYQFRTSDLSQANMVTLPAPTTTTTNPPSRRMRGAWMGRRSVAASGDYVFVRRNGTLYQFRASDLSLVTQTAMPIPNATTPPAGTP